MVPGQAITLHRLRLSLWWWTHRLRPAQEEMGPLELCSLSIPSSTQSSLSNQLAALQHGRVPVANASRNGTGRNTRCVICNELFHYYLGRGTGKQAVINEQCSPSLFITKCMKNITKKIPAPSLFGAENRGRGVKQRAGGVQVETLKPALITQHSFYCVYLFFPSMMLNWNWGYIHAKFLFWKLSTDTHGIHSTSEN